MSGNDRTTATQGGSEDGGGVGRVKKLKRKMEEVRKQLMRVFCVCVGLTQASRSVGTPVLLTSVQS